jgi:hypothetical protein
MPLSQQRRRDETDCRSVEAIQQDDHEAHEKNESLKAAERVLVDKPLDVDDRSTFHRFSPAKFVLATFAPANYEGAHWPPISRWFTIRTDARRLRRMARCGA